MTGRHSFELLRKGMSKESQARAEIKAASLLAEVNLADLRRAAQLTQEELASTLGVGQASVAKLEKRTDMFVSTLRRFIRAMGGELEIAAIFGGERVLIEQFHSLRPTEAIAAPNLVGFFVHHASRNSLPDAFTNIVQHGTGAHQMLISGGDTMRNIYEQRRSTPLCHAGA